MQAREKEREKEHGREGTHERVEGGIQNRVHYARGIHDGCSVVV